MHAHCNCNKSKRMMPRPLHLLKHWINMRNAYLKTNFRSKDLLFIHKNGKPSSYDCLNKWLQNAMTIVAKNMNVKMAPTNNTAHTIRQGSCTDMARHGVPSWRIQIEMTGRCASKGWKKMCFNTVWRDVAKLSGFTISSSLDQMKSQPL